MPIHYSPHGGNHHVSVVYCPHILGNRLGHLSQDDPNSWALRDFITGRMIRNTSSPNYPATSNQTLAEIEAEVIYSEVPPFYAVENISEWTTYLRLRTLAVLDLPLNEAPPNDEFGNWQPI